MLPTNIITSLFLNIPHLYIDESVRVPQRLNKYFNFLSNTFTVCFFNSARHFDAQNIRMRGSRISATLSAAFNIFNSWDFMIIDTRDVHPTIN